MCTCIYSHMYIQVYIYIYKYIMYLYPICVYCSNCRYVLQVKKLTFLSIQTETNELQRAWGKLSQVPVPPARPPVPPIPPVPPAARSPDRPAARIYTYLHIYIYICIHIYVSIYIYVYIYLYIYIYKCIGIGIPYWLFPFGYSLLAIGLLSAAFRARMFCNNPLGLAIACGAKSILPLSATTPAALGTSLL